MAFKEADAFVPSSDQVVVEMKAVGVNPVEAYIRSGQYALKSALPYTPGTDGAGVVKAVGNRVQSVSVGDKVYTAGSLSGTYAQEALCEESQIFPLAKNLNFEQGAGIYIPYTTAYRALFEKARPKEGGTILVHGASGGVGTAAVQLAVAAGFKVLATAGSAEGRQLVREQGAQYVYDHHSPDYRQVILKDTGDQGVDVILEMLANVNLGYDLELLAERGRVVVIGSRGTVEINPRDLMARDTSIMAVSVLKTSDGQKKQIQQQLQRGFEKGELCPVVGTRLPLKQAAAAHHRIFEGRAYGKIVLIP